MVNRNKLRGMMAEKNKKQIDVANALGISVNAFNMKLNGKTKFNESEVKGIADYLNVQIDFLFNV